MISETPGTLATQHSAAAAVSAPGANQNQHYAPQFLFKPWVGSDSLVETFTVKHGRLVTKRKPRKRIGYEPNLTTVASLPGAERHFVETDYYKPIDDEAALVHQALILPDVPDLTAGQRMTWAMFILSLILRWPETVAYGAEEFAKGVSENLAKRGGQFHPDPRTGLWLRVNLEEWGRANQPGRIESFPYAGVAELAFDQRNFLPVARADWFLIDRPASEPEFLTSTRPYLLSKDGNFPHCRWVMLLPISPDRVLRMESSAEIDPGVQALPAAAFVRAMNVSTIRNAEPYVIASDRSQQDLIASVWRAAGRIREPA
ncbi:MAG: DUF4238 domain-containing protein [Alphaproteobacteria bacterium]|nr:DUF4238 domain-containing protein [Alphaproteobacteria bacterium]